MRKEQGSHFKRWPWWGWVTLLVIGFFISYWASRRIDRDLREDHLMRGRMIAQAVNVERIQSLTGTNADLTSADYLRLKEQLHRICAVNPKCRFIYIISRRDDGVVFFHVDSEPAGSSDESHAGQTYDEIAEEDRQVFEAGQAAVTGPFTDRWGTWVSTLVPLQDPKTGKMIAVLGIDVDASDWRRLVLTRSALPVGLCIALLAALSAVLLAYRRFIEQKEAEEALLENESKLTSIVQGSPIPTFVIDRQHRITHWNNALEELSGISAQDVIGTREQWRAFYPNARPCLADFLLDEAYDKIPAHYPKYSRKSSLLQDAYEGTDYFPGLHGGAWLRFTAAAIRDSKGRISGAIETLEDITGSVLSEQALRESESRFRTVFESLRMIAIQAYESDGTITFWNKASEELYGYSSKEALGKNIVELLHGPETRDAECTLMKKAIESGVLAPSGEIDIVARDGTKKTVYASRVLRNRPGKTPEFFCFDIDITAGKKAEAEKERLEAELLQAQKMEAVGRLAGGVAHDFNNMLSIILGNVEMAMGNLDPSEPLYHDLDEIKKASQRSADLTRQLLAFARKQTIAPVVININDTIASTLQILRRLIGEDIRLVWRPEPKLWSIKMDPTQIDQILANLAINTRDAINGTGQLIIETGNLQLDETYCENHPGTRPGPYVMVTVSDDGCGMDKDTLARLFEPFFTTKDLGKGTGLGLAMVYGIVKQNNGIIKVSSEPGLGTTFKIFFPRHLSEDQQKACSPVPMDLPRGSETILLVEDELPLLHFLERSLKQFGYHVLPAKSPVKAMELSEEYEDIIHLLLTDVIMPGMNGRELAQRLLEARPSLKCLYMSGYTADVIAHHGVLDQGVHFMQKPYGIDELARKLRQILDGTEMQLQ